MAKRTVQRDPELLAHQQWLGYLQPVGLVVAPAAMQEAGWVVTRSGSELIERQERYREALEALGADEDGDADDRIVGFSSIETLLVDHLGWSTDQIQSEPKLIEGYIRELPELGETLQPTALVPATSGEGTQLLVQELPLLTPLDQKFSSGDQHWRATAQERFERLLREAGIEAGLLFNGSQLRLVVAPKGESSGHLTFTLKDLAEVSGRLMFSGLDLLLGQSHVFLDPDGYRLVDVLNKSRSYQAVVGNALADQVLAALWDLLRGFERADQLSQQQGCSLLGDIPDTAPEKLYGGLITVLMRFVFLLYAEDEALMPTDAIYEQNYKVSSIFEQLQQDAAEFPDTMEQRFGAWAGLMSLCRLVFDGGGGTADYLPARHGQLFDPEPYPWLETPWISDGAVYSVLSNLLVVNGERISYRALDVEQIGSVYEGIMGFMVQRIKGRSVGLKSKLQGSKKQMTIVVDLDELLALPGERRKDWLEERASITLPVKDVPALRDATIEAELLIALSSCIDKELFEEPLAKGSLIFQPTEERRRSGSHYTPRSLTRPIVVRALRPWLERCEYKPTEEQILAFKICDPAMGSGAFLVESCRYLAELLEQAWIRNGPPDALKLGGCAYGEEPLLYARRLITQTCLYGVDKNPFAVNLAKLSLWLVSISRGAPFTFVDHALKHGDSLIGFRLSEIRAFLEEVQLSIFSGASQQLKDVADRRTLVFTCDTRSDEDDDTKRDSLQSLSQELETLRLAGSLMVAACLQCSQQRALRVKLLAYLSLLSDKDTSADAKSEIDQQIKWLSSGRNPVFPFHWEIEFPEVFQESNSRGQGFDCILGNPPYLGGLKLEPAFGRDWRRFVVSNIVEGKTGLRGVGDLCAYFLVQSSKLISRSGTIALITTSTISQGDTKEIGLSLVLSRGCQLYEAVSSFPWPGVAAADVSIICLGKGLGNIRKFLNGVEVPIIDASLGTQEIEIKPLPIPENKSMAFQGAAIVGSRFILSEEELSLLGDEAQDERVVLPFIGGDELASFLDPGSARRAICFWDYPLDSPREDTLAASFFPRALKHVIEHVKPIRDQLDDDSSWNRGLRERWWQYGLWRPAMYKAIDGKHRVLARTRHSAYHSICFVPTKAVLSDAIVVFNYDDYASFAVLQSEFHNIWLLQFASSLGNSVNTRYSPTRCFATFPMPFEHQLSDELVEVGRDYEAQRRACGAARKLGHGDIQRLLNDPSESAKDIETLRTLGAALDTSVNRAYGFNLELSARGFSALKVDREIGANAIGLMGFDIQDDEFYFRDAATAKQFEDTVRALSPSASIHWRYGYCSATRKSILSCLAHLNTERASQAHVSTAQQAPKKRKSSRRGMASVKSLDLPANAQGNLLNGEFC